MPGLTVSTSVRLPDVRGSQPLLIRLSDETGKSLEGCSDFCFSGLVISLPSNFFIGRGCEFFSEF
jgi:hypothetical protein